MSKAWRYALASQISLYLGMFLCILIRPQSLSANDGISYFGNFAVTLIPYGCSLLLAAFFGAEAAHTLDGGRTTKPIQLGLYTFAALTAGIVVTPSLVDPLISHIHELIGTLLFSIQIVLASWLVLKAKTDGINLGLLLVQFGAGIMAALYLAPKEGLMLQVQIIFQMAFGFILLRSLSHFERDGVVARRPN